jgi:polyphenol oxidase
MTAPTAVQPIESIDVFASFGVRAYVTTRAFGSVAVQSDEPVSQVLGRWDALRSDVLRARRLATAHQVHGTRVVTHDGSWTGWLRVDEADGHFAPDRGTALAVTVADCVPVLIAHPSGAVAAIHAGWRGTAAGILRRALTVIAEDGLSVRELRVHLGPAICGRCYEVSPDVYAQLTGKTVDRPTTVDLRGLLAGQACAAGVRAVTVSDDCSRCDTDRFYSHRGGDAGRQAAAIIAD